MGEIIYWKNISAGNHYPQEVNAIIECPKGTRNKYELSKNSNLLLLDRVLHSSNIYPQNYGLIPGTFAEDGDPMDILVINTNAVAPLTFINARPIGVLLMEDEAGKDEKIVSVATEDPFFTEYQDLGDLPDHYIHEIREFFRVYKALEEPKYSEVKGWSDKSVAHELINKSVGRFRELYGDIANIHPE